MAALFNLPNALPTLPQEAPKETTTSFSGPASLYCLFCCGIMPVKDCQLTKTQFVSKKNQKPMARDTWVATCNTCGKKIRTFAKSAQ